MRALILAGGRGTRLRPLTHLLPKPLVPFLGEPYAVGLLRRLAGFGVRRATFLVGADAGPFRALAGCDDLGITVEVETEERALDTAGAVRRVLRRDGGRVLVCNGDVLTDVDVADLLARHEAAGATATLHLVPVADTSAFGVVLCDRDGRVVRFVEKPAPGTVAADTINAGTYVLEAEAFAAFPGDGPLSFERTVFPGLLDAGATLLGVRSDSYWQDLGTPARYLEGQAAVLAQRCRWPVAPGMRSTSSGALVHDTAALDPTAQVGAGAVIGADARVGAGARIERAALHERVVVGEGSTVTDAVLGFEAVVGPGVVLPPGSVLGPRSVVGQPC